MTQLTDLVPSDHILRRIDEAVDFSFIRDEVRSLYSHTGRPSVDPELAVRMMLIGYLFNLSENRLCDEIRMHVGYRWFCGLQLDDPVPNRSALVRLRLERWGPAGVFDRLFLRVVEACAEAGLIRGKNIGIDGTQVEANAAINSLEPIEKPSQYLERFDETSEESSSDEPPNSGGSGSSRRAGDPDFRGERWSNTTHRSATDPEARLYRKADGQAAQLSYLGHYAADLDTRVILDCEATQANGYAERSAALDMTGRIQQTPWGQAMARCVFDAGYRVGGFLAELIARGIDPVVPMISHDLEDPPSWQRRTFNLTSARKRKEKVRIAAARNHVRSILKSPVAKKLPRQRLVAEHLFAEAKVCHGLGRTRSRGLLSFAIQIKMTATIQNLKRLVYYRGKRQPACTLAQAARPLSSLVDDRAVFAPLVQLLLCRWQPRFARDF